MKKGIFSTIKPLWHDFFLIPLLITIYGKAGCQYCDAAKAMAKTLAADYEYVDIFSSPEAEKTHQELAEKYSHCTIPLILAGGEFIGGYTDFQQAHKSGKLAKLL